MATISSHAFNATVGTHAGGTAVRLTGSDGAVLFEAMMDDGGRLQQEIAADQGRNSASVLDARSGGALSSSGYAVAQQLFGLVVELIRKPEVAGLARSSRAALSVQSLSVPGKFVWLFNFLLCFRALRDSLLLIAHPAGFPSNSGGSLGVNHFPGRRTVVAGTR